MSGRHWVFVLASALIFLLSWHHNTSAKTLTLICTGLSESYWSDFPQSELGHPLTTAPDVTTDLGKLFTAPDPIIYLIDLDTRKVAYADPPPLSGEPLTLNDVRSIFPNNPDKQYMLYSAEPASALPQGRTVYVIIDRMSGAYARREITYDNNTKKIAARIYLGMCGDAEPKF